MRILKKTRLISEITAMAQIISDDKNNPAIVFIEFFGHASLFVIRIYNNGWSDNKKPDYSLETYTSWEEECTEKLEKMKKVLVELAKPQNKTA